MLLRVDPSSFVLPRQNNPPYIDLSTVPNDWVNAPGEYNYRVFGYPSADRWIDYEIRERDIRSATYLFGKVCWCEPARLLLFIGTLKNCRINH